MKIFLHNCLGILPLRKLLLNHWKASFVLPNLSYAQFDFAFKDLPESIKSHRLYFSKEKKGFGEPAFHTMWYYLFKRYRVNKFIEIGVYRGQVLSLISLFQKISDMKQNVTGISPMSRTGDSTLPSYIDIDYEKDILANFKVFNLESPRLIKAFSSDPIAIETITAETWDCIYIDGNHDYEIVNHDWSLCSQAVRRGGVIVLDDAALYTSYKSLKYGFRGHPGPSMVAKEINGLEFRKILQVGHNLVFQKL